MVNKPSSNTRKAARNKALKKAPVPKNIGNQVKGSRTSIQPPRKATSNPPAAILSIPTRINP